MKEYKMKFRCVDVFETYDIMDEPGFDEPVSTESGEYYFVYVLVRKESFFEALEYACEYAKERSTEWVENWGCQTLRTVYKVWEVSEVGAPKLNG